eukprot:10994940-Alexandrium_andersonii.AAC.1
MPEALNALQTNRVWICTAPRGCVGCCVPGGTPYALHQLMDGHKQDSTIHDSTCARQTNPSCASSACMHSR